MSTVWILGAGASRADNAQMPLVSDFLRVANSIGWFDGEHGARFLEIVAADFGFSIGEILTAVTIEELLTLAACGAAWYDLDPRHEQSLVPGISALATLRSLTYLIADVLIQVQRPSLQRGDSLHDALVSEMRDGDVVVSYNYDVIVDSALLRAGKSTFGNYHIPFDKRISGGRGTADGEISDFPAEPPGGIDLLKLHGSLNWFHLSHETLRSSDEFRFSEHPLFLWYESEASHRWQFVGLPPQFLVRTATSEPGRVEAVSFSPVVVPPTLDKADVWRSGGGVLRMLWEHAKAALERSTEVVLIGHSLNPADYQTRWLLRAALSGRRENRRITIVNNSECDRRRLATFFQSLGTVTLYETVQDLLSARDRGLTSR